jgi:hypothetical protein
MRSLLKCVSRRKPRAVRPIRRDAFHPRAEALERRDVPAGTGIAQNAGELQIIGGLSADTARVQLDDRGTPLYVRDDRLIVTLEQPDGPASALVLDLYRAGPTSRQGRYVTSVTSISFAGGAGGDTFVNHSGLPSRAYGGSGDDVLTGSSAADTFFGDTGDDILTGGGGADALDGGDHNDLLIGSAGDDRLFGGDGDDILSGGDGRDWLEAGSAAEFADGGGGADWNAHVWAVGGTTATDVNQGQTGTCVVLSSLAAATQEHSLAGRFRYLGNFSYGVQMYDPARGWLAVAVPFDGTMVQDAGLNIVDPTPAAEGESWVILYQRAYLKHFYGMDPLDGDQVASFDGEPNGNQAIRAILGGGAETSANFNAPVMRSQLLAGQTLNVGGTGHRYAVIAVFQDAGGHWKVTLYNPWGYDAAHKATMDFDADGSDDGSMTMTWAEFTEPSHFRNYTYSAEPRPRALRTGPKRGRGDVLNPLAPTSGWISATPPPIVLSHWHSGGPIILDPADGTQVRLTPEL